MWKGENNEETHPILQKWENNIGLPNLQLYTFMYDLLEMCQLVIIKRISPQQL